MYDISSNYFFNIFCSIFVFTKLLNIDFSKSKKILSLSFSMVIALLTFFMYNIFPGITNLLVLLIVTLFVKFISTELIIICFSATILSYIISYGAHSLSVIATSFIYYTLVISPISEDVANYIATTLAGILQIYIASLPFKIPRFKRGIQFLHEPILAKESFWLGSIFLFFTTLSNMNRDNKYLFICAILMSSFIAIHIFTLWKSHTQETYLINRYSRDLEILEKELNQQADSIENLKVDNDRLSEIVHRDNKLIPAFENAVRTQLTDSSSKDNGNKLLEQLESLCAERKGILKNIDCDVFNLVTDDIRTDAVLNYFLRRSATSSTNFSHNIVSGYTKVYPQYISCSDICTILADLLENAFYAVKDVSDRHVHLDISEDDNKLLITVYDNGVPFPKKILDKLGKKRITSHPNDGGSGIGLVTIRRIIAEYNADFRVEQNVESPIYTKAVCVVFPINLKQR